MEALLPKLEELRYDALSCPRCSNCKWVDHIYVRSHRFAKLCPISARYGFNAYSAPGLLDIALALTEERLDYTPALVDAVYHCLLCGACDVRCKRNLDIEVLEVLAALRRRCAGDGKGPLPAHRRLISRVQAKGNRYGGQPGRRRRWLPPGLSPTPQAGVLFFPGCNASYAQPGLARSVARLLGAAGVPFTLLAEERCCGYPLVAAGVDGVGELLEANMEGVRHSGASLLVTGCAHCYHTYKVTYPRLLGRPTAELGFEVLHLAEFALRLLEQGALRPRREVNLKMTYHDPCYLGRLGEPWVPWQGVRGRFGVLEPPKQFRRGEGGVYEPPREVLRRLPGVTLVEMERTRENAWCCGAGGGVADAYPDFARWTAGERVAEAVSSGAQAVGTACPYCRENLTAAAGDRLQVLDLAEALLMSVRDKEAR